MSITLSPSKAAYLDRVAEGLADLSNEDLEEVVQDLEAHLAELEDEEVESTLGSPEAFVSEFRQSAGLGDSEPGTAPGLIARSRARLEGWESRLSERTRWQSIRPLWIWVRGWLLVCAWSLLYDVEGFSRFPIPLVGGSTLTGLFVVGVATWLSWWLDRDRAVAAKGVGSNLFSILAGAALIGMLLNPMPGYSELVMHEEQPYFDHLTSAEGEPITNIYAYDRDGEPVQVLLYTQDGRPILTLPRYVYEEDFGPSPEPYFYGDGTVTFERDDFGRTIPNLYPLQLSRYDETGELHPVPPPSLGFPSR